MRDFGASGSGAGEGSRASSGASERERGGGKRDEGRERSQVDGEREARGEAGGEDAPKP